jgi:uncharacterized protein (TIGR03437 family)
LKLAAFVFALIPSLALAAVPVIQGVTDAAGYGPRAAPGSLATLFGTGFASGTAGASSFPLPTSLESCSVSVGGVLAPLLYVSAGQINFQVPSSVPAGDADIVVNGPGGSSVTATLTITAEAPAIFQNGTNHAAAQNPGGSLNSDSDPAVANSVITVYLTGQGAVSNPVTDGTAPPTSPLSSATATATATIGPLNAPVQFLGLAPGFAGLGQANIQVPALPTGDYPLVITVSGLVSASAVISISGAGTAYTSPLTLVGSVPFANSDTSSIVLYDNIAYVCGENNIVMVNISTLTAPTVIGEFGDSVLNGYGDFCAINTLGTTPFLVEVIGSESSSTESFAVFSLSTPQSPTLLTVASTPYGHLEDLSFSGSASGNYGFATDSFITYYTSSDLIASQEGDFLAFSFTNPAQPQFLNSLQGATGASNQNLMPDSEVVDQVYSFVASSTATGASTAGSGLLDVLSVANPSVPTIVSQVTVPQAAILTSFDVAGTTLLAAGNTTGQRNPGIPDFDFTGYLTLTSMDLTNVQSPVVVQTVTTQLQVNGTFYTAAFSGGVFAIVNKPPVTDNFGPSSLMIVDARTPSNLLLYPWQTQFGFSGILTTTNGYLLAPTSLGLNIYQLGL